MVKNIDDQIFDLVKDQHECDTFEYHTQKMTEGYLVGARYMWDDESWREEMIWINVPSYGRQKDVASVGVSYKLGEYHNEKE
jgi:hypothetical protein